MIARPEWSDGVPTPECERKLEILVAQIQPSQARSGRKNLQQIEESKKMGASGFAD